PRPQPAITCALRNARGLRCCGARARKSADFHFILYHYVIMIFEMKRDPSLDALLDLDGQVLVVDPATNHRIRFVVRQVPATEAADFWAEVFAVLRERGVTK